MSRMKLSPAEWAMLRQLARQRHNLLGDCMKSPGVLSSLHANRLVGIRRVAGRDDQSTVGVTDLGFRLLHDEELGV